MPAMKKRKADGPVVVNVDTSAPRRTYKKKGTYVRRASSNWRKFSKLKPWADFGAMRYPRGTQEGINRFGATYADATPEQRIERASVGWRGRGLYDGSGSYNAAKNFRRWATGAVSNVGRGVGRSLNNTLVTGLDTAGSIGNSMLAAQGAMALAGQGMYTGSGMYTSNSLVNGMNSRPSVQFESDNDESQSLVITHKEYVSDVFGPETSAFTNQTYALQPGLSQVFPFLAQFAQNFDEYEMIQMVWEFHSTVDANASTNASGNTGTIIMATNYKADAPPFSNKDEMIQYHGGVSGRLTEPLIHGVECDPTKISGHSGKYVRTAPVPLSDIKSYDVGLFNLAFQNTPTTFLNQQVGELWVHYKVKLAKPKLYSALGNTLTQARYMTATDSTITTQFGSSVLKASSNNINFAVSSSTAGTGNAHYVTRVNGKTVFTAANATAKGVSITFPANTSGVFELRLTVESDSTATISGNDVVFIGKTLSSTMTQNNIKPWFDVYGYNDGSNGDSPWFYTRTTSLTNSASVLIVRVKVETVTNGVDNTIVMYPYGDAGTCNSAASGLIASEVLEIIEIGSAFATSSTVAAPTWLDNITGQTVSVTSA